MNSLLFGIVTIKRLSGAVRPDASMIANAARALRSAVRASDSVAHLGNGRFALMLQDVSSTLGVRGAAVRIQIHLERELGEPTEGLSAAIGFAVSMPPHVEAAMVLEQARVAHMRAVKRTTRPRATRDDWACITIFDGVIDDQTSLDPQDLVAAS